MSITINGTTGSIAGTLQAGMVAHFANQTAPAGWLKCNGAAISRADYADLFSAIGTVYGVGDGSTTFNVPDLRGEFVRGWDDARGVDSGRGIGTAQADAFGTHTHRQSRNSSTGTLGTLGAQGVNADNNGFSSGAGSLTEATGGTETRPRNIALLACIKF